MRKTHDKIRIGITMGDPSGIGPVIIQKALTRLRGLAVVDFVVIGSSWVFGQLQLPAASCQLPDIRFVDLDNVSHRNFKFGRISAEHGRASMEYLDKALELIRKDKIDCLVTCPISKESINKAGFNFPGHTEYLAYRAHVKDFLMLLVNGELRISLVTRHIPLEDVPHQLNKDKLQLQKTVLLTCRAIQELFSIKKPRIVVCGLNPHASDNGLIGKQENVIIRPILEKLRKEKWQWQIDGPLSADVAISKAYLNLYDGVVAMYHDQALIPLKLLGADTGVNITFGLPFIRTSPLHGTAFDIAHNYSLANPNSLIEAIKLALKCKLNQKSP